MWLRRSDTQQELARISRDAIAAVWNPGDAHNIDPGAVTSSPAWRAAERLGWFDLLVDEAHGGLGLGPVDLGVVFEEAGRALFPGPLFASAVLRPRLDLLSPGKVGHVMAASLVDATAPRATPPSLAEGQLTGTCDLVEFPASSGILLVEAEEDGVPVLALVNPSAPGTTITLHPIVDPILGLSTVQLDAATADVIARGDTATEWLEQASATGHTLYASRMLGTAERMLEMAREYALTRHQFGRPIGAFQALQHLLADLAVAVATGRAACHVAQAALASERPDAPMRARVAKAHLSGVGRDVAEGALQVLGGIGFTTEHDLHLYYKHALTLQSLWGDERHHQDLLGRSLADRVRASRSPQSAGTHA